MLDQSVSVSVIEYQSITVPKILLMEAFFSRILPEDLKAGAS
jgi:hypothetical protein